MSPVVVNYSQYLRVDVAEIGSGEGITCVQPLRQSAWGRHHLTEEVQECINQFHFPGECHKDLVKQPVIDRLVVAGDICLDDVRAYRSKRCGLELTPTLVGRLGAWPEKYTVRDKTLFNPLPKWSHQCVVD